MDDTEPLVRQHDQAGHPVGSVVTRAAAAPKSTASRPRSAHAAPRHPLRRRRRARCAAYCAHPRGCGHGGRRLRRRRRRPARSARRTPPGRRTRSTTAASSHSPTPATQVSPVCESTESVRGSPTTAMPPCAYCVAVSVGPPLLTTRTQTAFCATRAAVSPATPPRRPRHRRAPSHFSHTTRHPRDRRHYSPPPGFPISIMRCTDFRAPLGHIGGERGPRPYPRRGSGSNAAGWIIFMYGHEARSLTAWKSRPARPGLAQLVQHADLGGDENLLAPVSRAASSMPPGREVFTCPRARSPRPRGRARTWRSRTRDARTAFSASGCSLTSR